MGRLPNREVTLLLGFAQNVIAGPLRLRRPDVRRGSASPQPFKVSGAAPSFGFRPKQGTARTEGEAQSLGGPRPARQSLASHRGGRAADDRPFGRAAPCISPRGGEAAEDRLCAKRCYSVADIRFEFFERAYQEDVPGPTS